MKIIVKIKNLFKRDTSTATVEVEKKSPETKLIRAVFWNKILRNVVIVGVMMSNLNGNLKILSLIGVWIISSAHLEVARSQFRNQAGNIYI